MVIEFLQHPRLDTAVAVMEKAQELQWADVLPWIGGILLAGLLIRAGTITRRRGLSGRSIVTPSPRPRKESTPPAPPEDIDYV